MNKKDLLVSVLTFLCLAVLQTGQLIGQGSDQVAGNDLSTSNVKMERVAGIDNLDTITFDLSQAVCSNGTVTFPISISSDDVIWALDFSMRWDLGKATYNSVISHKSYIMPTANYNTTDSTLRFSSFSLLAMEHNVALVSVKLDLIAGQINAEDLEIVSALLNGSSCSFKVIDGPLPASVSVVGNLNILPGDTTTLVATNTSPGCSFQWSTGSGSNLIFVTNPGTYSVTVTNPNGCSSSAFVTIGISNPLPVDLLYFEGRQVDQNVALEWLTASETNNSHFIVYRSYVLRSRSLIGTVPGAGVSSRTNKYNLVDIEPRSGLCYYFLEQHDMNGAVTEFGPIAVEVRKNVKGMSNTLKLYPNPVVGTGLNVITTDVGLDADWVIRSSSGHRVKTSVIEAESLTASLVRYLISIPTGLPEGLYLIMCNVNDKMLAEKFMIGRSSY